MAVNPELGNIHVQEGCIISCDGSGPTSRSLVTHVSYTVARFSEEKKKLVRDIGFGGILELPQISKVDRKFTLWLLTKLNVDNRCIIVNGQYITDVVDFEVARILGIPCGPREVCSLDCADKKAKVEFIQRFIGCSDHDTNSLTAAENIVKTEFHPPTVMNEKDKDNFKVSFVVWVIGHLLAPTKKHNVGSDRFFGALLAPDEINKFNWAGYVLDELLLAARDVQSTLNQKKTINVITGCSILLQILYFDSINMGSLNRPRNIIPRVKAYDSKSLSQMIAADKASSTSGVGNATWGCSVRYPVAEVGSQFTSHTRIQHTDRDLPPERRLINNFGKYVRENFGDKISTSQCLALSWFHARCTQQINQLRVTMQQDTIKLLEKLFGTPNSLSVHVPAKSTGTAATVRQAESEPCRPPTSARRLQKNKRPDDSSNTSYKRRVKYALPETLLSGMTVSDELEGTDEMSQSCQQSITETNDSGQNNVFPIVDLGIKFEMEAKVESDEQVATDSNIARAENAWPTESCTPKSIFHAVEATPSSGKNRTKCVFVTPDQRISSSTTSPGTLSKILAEGDLVERMTRSEDFPNANMSPWDDDYSDTPIKKRHVGTPRMSLSPWSYDLHHRNPPSDIVEKFFDDVSLSNFSTQNRPWVAHNSPRHIELDGTCIYKCFTTSYVLSYDVCDLLIRRFRQLDEIMYSKTEQAPWRHFIESEFTLLALAGEVPFKKRSIIEQFIGQSIEYKIENSRMIVIPAFILMNWCCYFFDFKEKCVHVIDPFYKHAQSESFGKIHLPNISTIGAALANCLDHFFVNWHHNIAVWDVNFVEPCIGDPTSGETGLLTLMYMRQFDGSRIHGVNRDSFVDFRKVMLYELMSLHDNPVKTPIDVTVAVDE